MDPFTEKLLERTRARRENLQKKMAERPNAANRAMVKRPREPLVDSNGVTPDLVTADKAPQLSSKPSPSKRSRSGENLQPAAGEENQEPPTVPAMAPMLQDPPTDKKPPTGSTYMKERPAAQVEPPQLVTGQAQPKQTSASGGPVSSSGPSSSRGPELVHAPVVQSSREDPVEEPSSSAAGMRSRLKRLADQRKGWDGSASEAPDVPPMQSVLQRQADVLPETVPSASSQTALGRRGRLANLASTIGSWEDDLSRAAIPRETAAGKPQSTPAPKPTSKDTSSERSAKPSVVPYASTGTSQSSASRQQALCSPVKSSGVICPSPQKKDTPAPRPELQSRASPQRSLAQTAARPPVSSSSSSSTPAPRSPAPHTQGPSGGLASLSGQKPEIRAKPTIASSPAPKETSTPKAPGVKSFLERFGERCQERSDQSGPAGGASETKTFTVTPSVSPNTKLQQERLRAAQAAKTTTADLTQKQKMERESELALIRSRFQKGGAAWNDKKEEAETKKGVAVKEPQDKMVGSKATPSEREDKPAAPPTGPTHTASKSTPTAGPGSVASRPAGQESTKERPEKPPRAEEPAAAAAAEEEEEEEVKEIEMNVDGSINSAVINELFDGVLEQSDDEEEEDGLNISSMSLLTPLAETVAAVVKSPERRMMVRTSTPASSFLVKSNTPDDVPKPSKFQRTNMIRTASSDSIEASDDDHNLPYSIDAYRSTRVKESERPAIAQVIVREEAPRHKEQELHGGAPFNIKHKMKALSNEMNLQQTVIHQASQALNCCTDEEHGKGSQVEAEAERLLLVATEKREALKAELERLKGEGPAAHRKTPEGAGPSASRGSITLLDLRLPLKADFVCSTANKPESTKHSFFLMIRAGAENTVATPLASTHRGLSGDTLTFPTKFTMSDVSSDFSLDVEVYCLVQKREVCSDKKKKPSKSKAITPKRFLAITRSAQTPVVASPGGPNAVRTSNFVLVGSHKLTLSSIGKNKFPLQKVPFLCPLEGHVYLKMQCEVGSKVEERGFLTMFEDVSGFGAWHRRWCVLSGYCISYWTYPDDERRKNPMGRINLANCTSKSVEPANREFCARPHTMELITVRPQREDDKETLVSQCRDTLCVTKNWLSADTKDERNVWMKKLNQILVDLRMWQPDACHRPL